MFTGLVEAVSKVTSVRSLPGGAEEISIPLPEDWLPDTKAGDSIACSGICLTVTALNGGTAVFQAVRETVNRSSVHLWKSGTPVNMERSLPANGRFGGHIVQGHVDTTSILRSSRDVSTGMELVFSLPAELIGLVAEKGSIALDGISLTVASLQDDVFTVAVIPETLARTTLGSLPIGGRVNVEADVFARYVMNALKSLGLPTGRIDIDFLKDHGFA